MGNTNGTISLIAGIISLCCFGFILGPIAIIIGAVGIKKDDEQTLSIIGIVLGVIGLVCWILVVTLWWSILTSLIGFGGYI